MKQEETGRNRKKQNEIIRNRKKRKKGEKREEMGRNK